MKSDQWGQIIAEIAGDRDSGAREITLKCAEAFASFASLITPSVSLDTLAADLTEAVRELLAGQPSMAPVLRVCNDVLLAIERTPSSTEALAELQSVAHDYRHRMENAEHRLKKEFLAYTEEVRSIVTLSYSSIVVAALRAAGSAGRNLRVTVLESRPAKEGRRLARVASEAGLQVALVVDAAAWTVMSDADLWISGADALVPNGLVNKIGTASLAAVAAIQGKPGIALAETLKIWPGSIDYPPFKNIDQSDVWIDPPSQVSVKNVIFEIVPWSLVTGILNEEGVLQPSIVRNYAQSIAVSTALAKLFV